MEAARLLLSAGLLISLAVSPTDGVELRKYQAHIDDCYDADTCTANFDLGLGVILSGQKVRLYGIDAWELRGEEKPKGELAKAWMNAQVANKDVVLGVVQKKKGGDDTGKYGRWLVIVFLGERNLNDELVKLGHAEYAEY
jgi:micrococcal nuclease